MRSRFLLLFPALAAACKPPEAPAGLNESLTYLLREFHSDDARVSAGLTGLMDWFARDGGELLGERADLENVGSFRLEDLQPSDVARFPVEGSPDVTEAPGVVSLAEMNCKLSRAQALLVRPDQHVVFEGTWETYDRVFDTPRAAWEGVALDEVSAVNEPIGEEALDAQPDALMITTNQVTASQLGFTVEFELLLRMRHGVFEIDGEPTEALLILSFMPRPGDAGGGNAIAQSWSIEADIARPGGSTLRVFGAWSELDSPLIAADAGPVLATGVNKAQDTAERLSAICSGEFEIPPE